MTTTKSKVSVTISENGPNIVTGDVSPAKQTISTDAKGRSEAWYEGEAIPPRETYAICRCGGSKNKPFCDGTTLQSASEIRRLTLAARTQHKTC
jgi:CDGSH-type Zn-finger protein